MNKLVELYYWFRIFLSPFLLLNAVGAYCYLYNENFLWLSILLGIVGAALGIFFAEHMRKSIGTTSFMSKINQTDDVKTYREIMESKNTKSK